MAKRKWIRKSLMGFGLLMVGLLCGLLALPLWFPWVLRPVGARLGFTYQKYARQGYARFVLEGVQYQRKTVTVKAGRAEAYVPTVWLWHLFSKSPNSDQKTYARVQDWTLQITTQATSTRPKPPSSVYVHVVQVQRILDTVHAWIPNAELVNGALQIKTVSLYVPQATWADGQVNGTVRAPKWPNLGTAKALMRFANAPTLQAELDQWPFSLSLGLNTNETSLQLNGRANWATNQVDLSFQFDRESLLPTAATIRAPVFHLPGAELKLPQYRELHGTLAADWRAGRLAVDGRATGIPTPETQLPPIEAALQLHGNTNEIWLETVRLETPWLRADLNERVWLSFKPPYLTNRANLTLAADLGALPWVKTAGQLKGNLRLQPNESQYPTAAVDLNGVELEFKSFQCKALQLQGNLVWPWAQLQLAQIELDDGSRGMVSGRINVAQKTLTNGTLKATLVSKQPWMPKRVSLSNADLAAEFEGSWTNLSHSGHLTVRQFVTSPLKPLAATGAWRGTQGQLDQAELTLEAGQSQLLGKASLVLTGTNRQAQFQVLTLQTNHEPVLRLAKPFTLVWAAAPEAPGSTNQGVNLQVTSVEWSGANREVRLAGNLRWPDQGHIKVNLQQLSPGLFADFLQAQPLPLEVETAEALLEWGGGPVTGSLAGAFRVLLTNQTVLNAQVDLKAENNGVAIQELSVAAQGRPVATLRGRLPITVQPSAPRERWVAHPDQPLQLKARTEPHAFIWEEVAKRAHLELKEPQLHLQLAGTLAAPEGEIVLRADSIKPTHGQRQTPRVHDLFLRVELARELARISAFRLKVEDEPIAFSGEIPLGAGFWKHLPEKRLALDWRQASARLQMPPIELAPWAEFLPTQLAPEGEVKVDVSLKPGGTLDGEIRVGGLRTRPLANFGAVRDIRARLVFEGHTVRLEQAYAQISGQPLEALGLARLPPDLWPANQLPEFTLQLRGSQVPLARQSELILRADLDVMVTNSPGRPPVITGDVRLRDSYYLSDLRDLIPGKVASPKRRPPYFSVEAEPWADWRLALRVQGQEFMKVRSPLFRGAASASLQLEGTLKEPLALGEVKINEGAVRFPFGNLEVRQGSVALTSANPYQPQVYIQASTRRIGYEIRMEVSGPADGPLVEFSSTPPLSSEQIVLMLTTGQMPVENARLSTGRRAQGVALFLGRNLLSELGIGGGDAERLTFRSGEEVTAQGTPTYEAEYKLSEHWSLVGQYDRFNQFNLGVKWRIYSR